ncbi:hypothetical protein AVEN_94413-1 [Araneus ventricosus]|uniref:Uncharacterized protein n=1 Tax=Araneus ventricosus TaxID=182803 RepID=A0A4Y2J249_ARAVE|nr:hypothetical protein AVEN_94413-1 [Araneus ventricosus]
MVEFDYEHITEGLKNVCSVVADEFKPCYDDAVSHYKKRYSEVVIGMHGPVESLSYEKARVCLGSLSCWKVNVVPKDNFQALVQTFCFKMSRYMYLFVLPSIEHKLPTPAALLHAHTMTPPSPHFRMDSCLASVDLVFYRPNLQITYG